MIANYCKTALRNMRRTRVFTFVNILGLSVGMAACLLILSYVRFERSFDRFYKDSDRIYRIAAFREFDKTCRYYWCSGWTPG